MSSRIVTALAAITGSFVGAMGSVIENTNGDDPLRRGVGDD